MQLYNKGIFFSLLIDKNNLKSISFKSILLKRFQARVLLDGGILENTECLKNLNYLSFNWKFYFRVVDNGGIIESLECVTF